MHACMQAKERERESKWNCLVSCLNPTRLLSHDGVIVILVIPSKCHVVLVTVTVPLYRASVLYLFTIALP